MMTVGESTKTHRPGRRHNQNRPEKCGGLFAIERPGRNSWHHIFLWPALACRSSRIMKAHDAEHTKCPQCIQPWIVIHYGCKTALPCSSGLLPEQLREPRGPLGFDDDVADLFGQI